jgi:hypothetical protein
MPGRSVTRCGILGMVLVVPWIPLPVCSPAAAQDTFPFPSPTPQATRQQFARAVDLVRRAREALLGGRVDECRDLVDEAILVARNLDGGADLDLQTQINLFFNKIEAIRDVLFSDLLEELLDGPARSLDAGADVEVPEHG